MTRVLKRWKEKKSSSHPSTCALTSAETVALKVYSIEIKYYSLSFVTYSKSDALYVIMLP